MSAERFQRLGTRVSVVIYHGPKFIYDPKGRDNWKVHVEFLDNGTKIEQETQHASLDIALDEAYTKLDKIVSNGLGPSAMMPALEAPEVKVPRVPDLNDDIPF